ncbi:hypothetical protein PR048_017626 [Dryococelus australis]|uniref:Ammonium transporter AmtB-like domain-containing protein n=1 Tax=Dryococelus australis TaxID=614101 RepID=A0ABQ9HAL7_9NEOP|nr:hypothetical protein PR048_017626 [Dryococelus australis]
MNTTRDVIKELEDLKTNIDAVFLLSNGIVISLMQCGFACLEAGSVRSKNATNIIMKNVFDMRKFKESLTTRIPPKQNGFDSRRGRSPEFNKWESCWTMLPVRGFSRGSPVSPPLLSGAAPCKPQSPSSALKISLAVAYWLVGYAIAYGDGNGMLGLTYWAGAGLQADKMAHWFFQFVFAATAATIISGAVAERCNYVAYITYSAVVSGFVYPMVSHWVWSEQGWLQQLGFKDFAGSGVVHLLGGTCSLVAAVFLGPRLGRFDGTLGPEHFVGHSTPVITAIRCSWGWVWSRGIRVAPNIEKLRANEGRPPLITAIRVRFPAGSLPDLRIWEFCWMMPLAGGFSRGTPRAPLHPMISFHVRVRRAPKGPGWKARHSSEWQNPYWAVGSQIHLSKRRDNGSWAHKSPEHWLVSWTELPWDLSAPGARQIDPFDFYRQHRTSRVRTIHMVGYMAIRPPCGFKPDYESYLEPRQLRKLRLWRLPGNSLHSVRFSVRLLAYLLVFLALIRLRLHLVGTGGLLLFSGFLAFNGASLGTMLNHGDGAVISTVIANTVMAASGAGLFTLAVCRLGLFSSPAWSFTLTLNAALTGMANLIQSPAGSLPHVEIVLDDATGWRVSRGSTVSPTLSFWRCFNLTSIILAGSQDLAVSVCGAPDEMSQWSSFVTGLTAGLVYLTLHYVVLRLRMVRLLASHQGEPASIPGGVAPGFSHVGIAPDDAFGRRVSSEVLLFIPPFNSGVAPIPQAPSPALKVSLKSANYVVAAVQRLGFVGSCVYCCVAVDDPLDAVAVHMGGGLWGLVSASVLTRRGLLYRASAMLLAYQFVGAMAIFLWSGACCCVMFGALKALNLLRVSRDQELIGISRIFIKGYSR